MEKKTIVSSIPLHIAPGVGCAGVMLINEPIPPSEISQESELKEFHDLGDVDDDANKTKP